MTRRSRTGGWSTHASVTALCALSIAVTMSSCDALVSDRTKVQRARSQLAQGNLRAAIFNLKSVLNHSPSDAAARLELARVSLKLGDLDSAATELSRALQAGVRQQEIGLLDVDILIARGDYAAALQRLAGNGGLPNEQHAARVAAAQAGLGQLGEARETLHAALRAHPDSTELLIELAKITVQERQFAAAEQLISRVLKSAPNSAAAWLIEGALRIQEGDYKAGEAAFTQGRRAGEDLHDIGLPELCVILGRLVEIRLVLGNLASAAQAVNELEYRLPGAPPTRYLRARILMAGDDPRGATAELQRALAVAPDFVAARRLLGAALLADGRLEQAAAQLSQVLASDPEDGDARKLLAQVELARKRPSAATRILSEAGVASRADPQFEWLEGTALVAAGDDAGIAYLERSLAAVGGGARARIELAQAYLMAGRRHDAIAVLEAIPSTERTPRAEQLLVIAHVADQPKEEALRALGDLLAHNAGDGPMLAAAGAYALSVGELNLAEAYLDRSMQADPRDVVPRLALAQVAVRGGDLTRAEQLLRETIQIDPRAERAYLGLSWLRWMRGARDEAQQLLQQAIAADPSAVAARLDLARIAFATSDPTRGRALLDQAAKAAPDDPDVRNAIGEVLLASGHLDDALSRFAEASANGSWRARLNVARTHLALGHTDEARRLFDAAAADPAGNPLEAGVFLAALDARQGLVNEALARIARLRRAGLADAVADELAGDAYVAGRLMLDASRAYDLAFAKRPTSSLVVKVFRVRQALNQPDPQRGLVRWLQSAPNDRVVRWEFAQYLQSIEDRQGAITQYERLRSEGGETDPILLNNLAWLYSLAKDPRAVGLARRAHDLDSKSPEISDTYGWVLLEFGDAREGLTLLRRAMAAAPNNGDIAYHVAVALARLGNKPEARVLLRQLLQSNAHFASHRDAEALRDALAAE